MLNLFTQSIHLTFQEIREVVGFYKVSMDVSLKREVNVATHTAPPACSMKVSFMHDPAVSACERSMSKYTILEKTVIWL